MYRHQETSKNEVGIPASVSTTRLPDRWLFLARSVCALLILLALGIFIATLPVYYTLLQTVCTVAAQCVSDQLSTHTAPAIHSLGLSLTTYSAIAVSIKGLTVLIWTAVAALLFWRKSEDWLALLVTLMLVTVITGNAENDQPVLTHLVSPSSAFIIGACSNFLNTLSFFLVFSLFPDGRFVPRWTRWILPLALAWGIVNFFPSLSSISIVTLLGQVLWGGCGSLLALAQIYRYWRVSNPRQRQQTKWVAFSLAIVLFLAIIGGFLLPLIFPSLGQPDSLYQVLFVQWSETPCSRQPSSSSDSTRSWLLPWLRHMEYPTRLISYE